MISLTAKQVETYQRNGVIVLRNFLSKENLESIEKGMRRCRDAPSARSKFLVDGSKGEFFFDARTIGEIEEFDGVATDTGMAKAAGNLMKSQSAIPFYHTVFQRAAGTQHRTPWHQDQPSWSASGDQACSMWIPLDEVPQDTALEFVLGSHRWEQNYARAQFFQTEYEEGIPPGYEKFPDIEAEREKYDIAAWAMSPGDCAVFHGMMAHGGSGNLPENLGRRTISIQWLGDDARYRVVPGGDDPDISVDLAKYGVKPGDPLACDICPVAWQAP